MSRCEAPIGRDAAKMGGRPRKRNGRAGPGGPTRPFGAAPVSACDQQVMHRWLFFEPSDSSSFTTSGIGETRETGPFAMSATVWSRRLTTVMSAPFDIRYLII